MYGDRARCARDHCPARVSCRDKVTALPRRLDAKGGGLDHQRTDCSGTLTGVRDEKFADVAHSAVRLVSADAVTPADGRQIVPRDFLRALGNAAR